MSMDCEHIRRSGCGRAIPIYSAYLGAPVGDTVGAELHKNTSNFSLILHFLRQSLGGKLPGRLCRRSCRGGATKHLRTLQRPLMSLFTLAKELEHSLELGYKVERASINRNFSFQPPYYYLGDRVGEDVGDELT